MRSFMQVDDSETNSRIPIPNSKIRISKKLSFLWPILPIIGLIIILSALNKNQSLLKKAAENSSERIFHSSSENIKGYNKQLIELAGTQKKDKNLITSTAVKRKQILVQEIKESPRQFLEDTLPKDVREALEGEVDNKGLFEQKVKLKGKLDAIHGDNFKDKLSVESYKLTFVDETDGLEGSYDLYFSGPVTRGYYNREVFVEGTVLDSEMVVKPEDIRLLTPVTESSERKTAGNFRIAILMFNFSNYRYTPFTKEEIESVVFKGQESVNKFFMENSYNQVFFTGTVKDIYGWLEIDSPSQKCELNIVSWADKADKIAALQGFVPSDYDFIAYVFPFEGNCPWGGFATISGNKIWLNGLGSGNSLSFHTFAHELGHCFGLLHANLIRCKSKTIDIYDKCTVKEYFDRYSFMGVNNHHASGAFKRELGYIGDSQVEEINKSGIYTLTPIETSGGTKTLKIPKRDTNQYYYLEYRQPLPYFDQDIAETAQNVTIRIWDKDNIYVEGIAGSFLVDNTPLTNYENDEGLSDGKSFIDEINNIQIKQLSHTATGVTVEIIIVPPTPLPTVTPDPFALPTPTPGINAGKALYFSFKNWQYSDFVKIDDNKGVSGIGNQMTIEMWIRPEKEFCLDTSYIFTKRPQDPESNKFVYYLGLVDSEYCGDNLVKPEFRVQKASGEQVALGLDEGIKTDGTAWYHLAVTKVDKDLTLYLNGIPKKSLTLAEEPVDYTNSILAFAQYPNPYEAQTKYYGGIDDVRISNITRNVEQNWQSGVYFNPLTVDQNTIALWRFDDNLLDSGNNHLDGVAVGSVGYTDGRVPYPILTTPTLTPVPTATFIPVPTSTFTPVPTFTNIPTPTASQIPTPIPSRSPYCNKICFSNQSCGDGLTCKLYYLGPMSVGLCRNKNCPNDKSCLCQSSLTPTPVIRVSPTRYPTPRPTSTPIPSPTLSPNPNCNKSCFSNQWCGDGWICKPKYIFGTYFFGYCRNKNCPDDKTCLCGSL